MSHAASRVLHRDGTPLTVTEPAPPARGGVVVVQEAFGVNAHIEEVCARLAGAGWAAVAPHLFWREGDPRFAYEGQMDEVMRTMGTLDAQGIRADVAAALAELEARGLDQARCAIVGFCMGGNVALVGGADHALGAAVTFYGGGVRQGRFGFPALVDVAPQLRSAWLGLYGDQDQGIPVEDVESLRAAAARAPVRTELVRYPDAGHGFHCDHRSAYHEPSARDAWTRMLRWFEENVPAAA